MAGARVVYSEALLSPACRPPALRAECGDLFLRAASFFFADLWPGAAYEGLGRSGSLAGASGSSGLWAGGLNDSSLAAFASGAADAEFRVFSVTAGRRRRFFVPHAYRETPHRVYLPRRDPPRHWTPRRLAAAVAANLFPLSPTVWLALLASALLCTALARRSFRRTRLLSRRRAAVFWLSAAALLQKHYKAKLASREVSGEEWRPPFSSVEELAGLVGSGEYRLALPSSTSLSYRAIRAATEGHPLWPLRALLPQVVLGPQDCSSVADGRLVFVVAAELGRGCDASCLGQAPALARHFPSVQLSFLLHASLPRATKRRANFIALLLPGLMRNFLRLKGRRRPRDASCERWREAEAGESLSLEVTVGTLALALAGHALAFFSFTLGEALRQRCLWLTYPMVPLRESVS